MIFGDPNKNAEAQDNRGATLKKDDRIALRRLYKGDGSRPAPPGGGTPGSLAAPSNVTARATSSTTLELRWKDNSSDETAFDIRIKVGGSAWQRQGFFAANTTGVDFYGATPGQTYKFMVLAKRGQEYSQRSNIATVKMPVK